jgi:hypothetical protein
MWTLLAWVDPHKQGCELDLVWHSKNIKVWETALQKIKDVIYDVVNECENLICALFHSGGGGGGGGVGNI